MGTMRTSPALIDGGEIDRPPPLDVPSVREQPGHDNDAKRMAQNKAQLLRLNMTEALLLLPRVDDDPVGTEGIVLRGQAAPGRSASSMTSFASIGTCQGAAPDLEKRSRSFATRQNPFTTRDQGLEN
jgi:hypothetical protein